MNIVLFYHSLVSDWNHGNAHFLRGIARELTVRGHEVRVFEPRDAWSAKHLVAEQGEDALQEYQQCYPELQSHRYDPASLNMEEVLEEADLAVVHEWNDAQLVKDFSDYRRRHDHVRLLFHDTHHRAVSDPRALSAYDLSGFDGVLAFGNVIRDLYLRNGWARRAWTWHEAADTSIFKPMPELEKAGDLIWIGNWGDGERADELRTFLLDPATSLGLRARVYGVRYPAHAREVLTKRNIEYGAWLPNYRVPEMFARFRVTVHVPRRPYVEALPGVPTIRPFEAMACGIPLVCSPWNDCERLFSPGRHYLVAHTGREMEAHLRDILADPEGAAERAEQAREIILKRHTCAHRIDELMKICDELGLPDHEEKSAPRTEPQAAV